MRYIENTKKTLSCCGFTTKEVDKYTDGIKCNNDSILNELRYRLTIKFGSLRGRELFDGIMNADFEEKTRVLIPSILGDILMEKCSLSATSG